MAEAKEAAKIRQWLLISNNAAKADDFYQKLRSVGVKYAIDLEQPEMLLVEDCDSANRYLELIRPAESPKEHLTCHIQTQKRQRLIRIDRLEHFGQYCTAGRNH